MATYKHLDALLQSFVENGLPGCSLQIAQRGETLYEGYFGYADLETKAPLTRDNIFRQASMSKIPLCTVAMMLYEKGKFLLTDPIYDFLPEWKDAKKFVHAPNGYPRIVPLDHPITIGDVLSMKCPLPYCNFPAESSDPSFNAMVECMKPLWEKGHFTNREQVAAISKAPLACEPGTKWMYGFSSELTAAVIEAVCAKSIDAVFEEMLFAPLGMDSTRSHFFGDIEQRMVKLYALDGEGRLVPTSNRLDLKHRPEPEYETGWARLFSNVNDFTKLMQMLANGGVYNGERIMGRKTIDLMRANGLEHPFDDLYNAGYGYGYGVRTLVDKEKGNHNGSLGAFGWTGGFGTWCEADPEDGVSIVYMHNRIPNGEAEYHLRMRAAAYGCIR